MYSLYGKYRSFTRPQQHAKREEGCSLGMLHWRSNKAAGQTLDLLIAHRFMGGLKKLFEASQQQFTKIQALSFQSGTRGGSPYWTKHLQALVRTLSCCYICL